jgi:predicted MFS family arabinose efflux permease
MEVTYIVLALMGIGLLIYCGMKLNSYSLEKYDYTPINLSSMFLMVIPYILFFCAFVLFKGEANQIMAIISTFIIIYINFLYIQNKTDFYVAFGSTLILLLSGFLLALLIFGNSRNNNNDDYYYR